jgi:glycosyltransferase involved in cell wall biosynthesis
MFVGRTYAGSRLKGLDCLLEAFADVRLRVPEARLRVVGTSAVEPQPGVDVIGEVNDRARMAELYASSRVFCLPSRFEAYGGSSTCEAMAHALPCVVTRVGGLPEVVVDGETGIVVPPGDPRALAAALTRVLADESLADRLGCAGRRRVEEFLNWDSVVDRMGPALEAARSRLVRTEATHGPQR